MFSHVVGSTNDVLLEITIGDALDVAVARWGERLALVDRGQGVRLSWAELGERVAALAAGFLEWAELGERVAALAAGFLELGLAPGDRIGVLSLNRVEWVLTQFAAAKTSLVLVTINPAYRLGELDHALTRSGCRAIIVSPPFKSSNYPAMIRSVLPCTVLYGVPTMFIAELDHPLIDQIDLSSLRTGIMAGSPCPIEVMRRVAGRMHMSEVTICYGMTETSPVSFQSSMDDSLQRRVTTVGRVHPHVEVKIIDENNEIVPRGVQGELCTRGYSVMLGYWNDPKQTAVVKDDDGWMHSGDLATIDEKGYCNIVGRLKDMVIRGGENLYPREIEDFLYRHPAIRDVQVFGLPDPRYGEELCAWVIRHEGQSLTEDELKDFCRGAIAHQKVPRYVRFVDAFPQTITGKVQKFIMREAMIKELDLEVVETA